MSDPQLFYVALAVLYAAECFYRLPANAVVFQSVWPGQCRAGFPRPVMSGRRFSFALANPIPCFGTLFYAPTENVSGGDGGRFTVLAPLRPLRRLWLRYRRGILWARAASTAHFLILFVALPLVWTFWGHRFIIEWIIAFLISTVHVLLAARRLHKLLFPDESWWPVALRLLIYPPAAMQAPTSIAIESFAAFHPVAVAATVCSTATAADLCGRFLRDFLYPVPESPVSGESSRAGSDPSLREELGRELRHFASGQGWNAESLLSPPAEVLANGRRYCPRCFAEYAGTVEKCGDCQGVSLRTGGKQDQADPHFGS